MNIKGCLNVGQTSFQFKRQSTKKAKWALSWNSH